MGAGMKPFDAEPSMYDLFAGVAFKLDDWSAGTYGFIFSGYDRMVVARRVFEHYQQGK